MLSIHNSYIHTHSLHACAHTHTHTHRERETHLSRMICLRCFSCAASSFRCCRLRDMRSRSSSSSARRRCLSNSRAVRIGALGRGYKDREDEEGVSACRRCLCTTRAVRLGTLGGCENKEGVGREG
jgi:hypothetical protein